MSKSRDLGEFPAAALDIDASGAITTSGPIDGRDVSTDGAKLDTIETSADVTDTANVTASGALMDSELASIASVKALNQGVATTDDPTFTNTHLAAIDATIAATAVDTFVYDTRKDSDGGAWRKRTQHTSWYNETLNTATRGSRKEFPTVAVIVAESGTLTIYDGDDPAMPMWMVFNGSGGAWADRMLVLFGSARPAEATSALNGIVCLGTISGNDSESGLFAISFLKDSTIRYSSYAPQQRIQSIADRDVVTPNQPYNYAYAIVNGSVHDVAMTVLPNAPIDPATGLPVPTIACLVGESQVSMADGTVKSIIDIEVGDTVKTSEGDKKVVNFFNQGVKETVELEFDTGDKLICTPDHKIKTTVGWVEAGKLDSDHEVVSL